MGWSLETVRPKLDIIFKSQKIRYRVQHPNALSPRVFIQHEGQLDNEVKGIITAVFPEGTYVDFFPNVVFPETYKPVQLVPKLMRREGRSFENIPTYSPEKGIAVKVIKKGKKVGG